MSLYRGNIYQTGILTSDGINKCRINNSFIRFFSFFIF